MNALAWRNLWRHPRRTLLTAGAIGFTAAVLIFFTGLQLSSYDTMINVTTSVFHGHAQALPQGYADTPRIRTTLKQPLALARSLRELPMVTAASVRAETYALASAGNRTYGGLVLGVQPEFESKVSTLPTQLTLGRYLRTSDSLHAVIGSVLARNLRLNIGDELTLLGQGKDGSVAATVLEVIGIARSGDRSLDGSIIQLPLPTFQETFSLTDEAHRIILTGTSLDALPELQASAARVVGPDVQVLRWDELLPGVKEAIELDLVSGWFFYLCLVLVVACMVTNTFLMSVLERTHEFGVLLALGMSPERLRGTILLECSYIAFIGLAVGLGIGATILGHYSLSGFSIPGSEAITEQWNLPAIIYPQLSLAALTIGPLIILICSLVAAWYPAQKVARLAPLDALNAN